MNNISRDSTARIRDALLSEEPALDSIATLVSRELGTSDETAKRVLYQVVLELNRGLFPPISHIELVHTEGCNLACTYCFEKDMLGHARMPDSIAKRAIDLLFDYSEDEKELQITHFGGEPTLNFPGIRSATEYAERKAALLGKTVEFDMTTNGVILTEEMVDYCADHRIRVLLSIDGCETANDKYRVDKKGVGTFARVIKGLNILKKRQPWIGTKMTVMPENAGSLFEDVLGLYALGVNHFIVGHATGVDWPDKAIEAFEENYGQLYRWYRENPKQDLRIDDFEKIEEGAFFGCQAGRNSLAVSVRGELSPCSKIMGFGSQNLLSKMGDVWLGMTHLRNRSRFVNPQHVVKACEEHGVAHEYQGGCFAVNYGESGDLFTPSLKEHAFSLMRRSACAGCSSCG